MIGIGCQEIIVIETVAIAVLLGVLIFLIARQKRSVEMPVSQATEPQGSKASFCSYCGIQRAESANFCHQCGAAY